MILTSCTVCSFLPSCVVPKHLSLKEVKKYIVYKFLIDVTSARVCSGFATGAQVEGRRRSEEEHLLDHLFENYNPSARPVINSSKTVTVGLSFSLLQIQELVRTSIVKSASTAKENNKLLIASISIVLFVCLCDIFSNNRNA